MFLAGSAIIAFTKPVMKILTTDEFFGAWEYVPVLAISMVFTALTSFMGTVYVVNKKSVISFATALLGAVINIILNLILIPSSLGVQGAAIATAISYIVVFVVRAANSRKYIKFKLYTPYVMLNSLIVTLQTVTMLLGVKYWIIIQAACVIALIVINFKFFIGFIKKIFSSVLRGK